MASSNLKPRNQNIALDKNSSVAVQVHYHLRQQILRLNLKPGIALSEKELSLQLGVSRTPVREAFIRLSEEGLVDIFPQRAGTTIWIRGIFNEFPLFHPIADFKFFLFSFFFFLFSIFFIFPFFCKNFEGVS